MPLPTVTALPTPPSRSDAAADFNLNADAFLGALPTFVTQLNDYGAALPSVITGTDFTGTSSTSVAVGTGSKSFTANTGKNWQVGQSVRIASTASPSNFMDGQVTAYTSGTGALVVNVTAIGGTGTLAAWTIFPLPSGGTFATLTGAETLTNKTLTLPVIASISNTGTITLPTGTRTLVARDTTDTLTNKTIDTAGTNVIKVNGNTLAASAGTATLTLPNSSDTIVGRATTDTLTNKTLTTPTINTATINTATVSGLTVSSLSASIPLSSTANLDWSGNGGAITYDGTNHRLIGPTGGSWVFRNSTDTASLVSIDNSGNLNLDAGGVLKVAGTQVVGPRDTGWAAMTGTPDKASVYATSTVTTAQLAGRVKYLQDVLTAHGLIGA